MRPSRPSRRPLLVAAPLCALGLVVCGAPAASGAAPASAAAKVTHLSRAQLQAQLRSAGHQSLGGVSSALARSTSTRVHTLPHFSSSFSTNGVTYPYTMLGRAPRSGQATELRTVIVPLRVTFTGFGVPDVTFDPARAVTNMVRSPIYRDASYANGRGQFGDQLQRATFWNAMDRNHEWRVRMATPEIVRPVSLTVTPDIGELDQVDAAGDYIGNLRIEVLDAKLHSLVTSLGITGDETPLFVTQNVTADALGYHDAYQRTDKDGATVLQTLMYSSWLDESLVGPLLADVSTLNHEVAEWLNDPFVTNAAPLWAFPPNNLVCGDNPYVEVGDPQGNGPDYNLFPTVEVPLGGFTYHLQDIALLQWFTRETPSRAYRGWYAFPDPAQLTGPSVDCPA